MDEGMRAAGHTLVVFDRISRPSTARCPDIWPFKSTASTFPLIVAVNFEQIHYSAASAPWSSTSSPPSHIILFIFRRFRTTLTHHLLRVCLNSEMWLSTAGICYDFCISFSVDFVEMAFSLTKNTPNSLSASNVDETHQCTRHAQMKLTPHLHLY